MTQSGHSFDYAERDMITPQGRHLTFWAPPASPNPRVASTTLKSWKPSRH